MTFNDLEFHTHQWGEGKACRVKFENGYGVSIVGGTQGLYGDGINDFEVAIFKGDEICYGTPLANDVLGWQTIEEINSILAQVEAFLPDQYPCSAPPFETLTDEEYLFEQLVTAIVASREKMGKPVSREQAEAIAKAALE